MTVQSQTSRADYTGNGATTLFAVPFYFLLDTDLQVIRTDYSTNPVSVVTLVLNSDYTVTGASNPAGGSITMTVAPTVSMKVSILRVVPFTQLKHYVPNDPFPAASHEGGLDKLTMIVQQLDEQADRALTLPANVVGVSATLPTPVANQIIGWNQNANALQNVDATTLTTIVAYGTAKADIFSGNGSQKNFSLTANPGAQANLDVIVGGVGQRAGIDYTWAGGTTVSFVTAPPSGTNNIQIRYFQGLAQGSADAAATTFVQAGTGAITRIAQDKMREVVSVKDFGAVGDGVTNDTAAFTNAQNAATFVEVPTGMNCSVGAGLNYWKFFGRGKVFEPGKQWTLPPYPQTGAIGKHYVERTFGNYEQAVGQSITVNAGVGQTKENTQVLGTDTQGLAQNYLDRDHVAQYLSASSYTPDVLNSSTTYTATSLTNAAVPGLAANIKPGMVIDTLHATICTGRVQSVSGAIITVDAWYPRSGGGAVTPANGIGAIINPNNKIFGQNIVVSASGNGTTTGASKMSGIELDLFTGGTVGVPTASPVTNTWGIDLVSMQYQYIDIGYQVRGKRNISYFSNNAGGAGLYGFRSVGDARGVSVQDATALPIEVIAGGSQVFGVALDGTVAISAGNIRFIGPLQTTTSFASIGAAWVTGHGALFYITGYNIANGAEGKFIIAANNTGAGSVYSSDGTGLTVAFQISGNTLQIKTASGTYQFTAFQLLV